MKVSYNKLTNAVCRRCGNTYTVEDTARSLAEHIAKTGSKYEVDPTKFCIVCALAMKDGYVNPADWA